nr:GHKL domain-containing protein [uncultured Blautia sp.]
MSLKIFNSIIALLANALRFYALKYFVGIFVQKEESKWNHVFILYIIGWAWTSVISLIFFSPAMNILSNIASLFLIFLPYRIKKTKKCLAVFVIYVINALVDSIVILSLTKYMPGQPVNQVYECITSFILLLIAIIIQRTTKSEQEITLPTLNMIALLMVPVISTVYIYYLVITVHEIKGIVIFAALALLFINILIFYLYHSLLKFYSARMNEQVFKQMLEVYSYQLDIARESEERVKALRHDIKHHIIELSAMAKKNNNDDMIKYLSGMKDFMLNPKEYSTTGNQEIDGVLNYMLQKANKTLNQVDVQINIPEDLYFNNFNICVILGNLVDNAVREASKSKEKLLTIKMQIKQEVLLIFIENSYSGKILEKKNGLQTTQTELAIHGIGLENVKKVVLANGGEIKTDYTSDRFCVQVLLYMSQIKN